ncbi:unnamed protein product [Peniophora sp. CBMAI 1063]|nr:unnamed protein product [Peniophora sp. CBMAI 1063]
MPTVDPTYPLYPAASFMAAMMLLLVLFLTLIHKSWNLGVLFLNFWLLSENLVRGANAIVWSDNAEIKNFIYCDIASRVQLITYIVKPMATLIITRRLYLVANLRSASMSDTSARRKELIIEWTLGLGIPLLVAGPFYYIVQGARFSVYEGFGCQTAPDGSTLHVLLFHSWAVFTPLLSITLYCPRIIWVFYHHWQSLRHLPQTYNKPVSRIDYVRIFAIASVDALFTLPIGIVNVTLLVQQSLNQFGHYYLYTGWKALHGDWTPQAISYADLARKGTTEVVEVYFTHWTSPILAFVAFGLFGFTKEAREAYWGAFRTLGSWAGNKPVAPSCGSCSSLDATEFGERA